MSFQTERDIKSHTMHITTTFHSMRDKERPHRATSGFQNGKTVSGMYQNQKSEWVWVSLRATLEARRPRSNAFKILKQNDFQP